MTLPTRDVCDRHTGGGHEVCAPLGSRAQFAVCLDGRCGSGHSDNGEDLSLPMSLESSTYPAAVLRSIWGGSRYS